MKLIDDNDFEEQINIRVENNKSRMNKLNPIVAEYSDQQHKKQNKTSDQSKKIIDELEIGSKVALRKYGKNHKMESNFSSPYFVYAKDMYNKYILKDINNKILTDHYSIDMLKIIDFKPKKNSESIPKQIDIITQNEKSKEKEIGYVKRILKHEGVEPNIRYLTEFENGEQHWLTPADFDANITIEKYWNRMKKTKNKKSNNSATNAKDPSKENKKSNKNQEVNKKTKVIEETKTRSGRVIQKPKNINENSN